MRSEPGSRRGRLGGPRSNEGAARAPGRQLLALALLLSAFVPGPAGAVDPSRVDPSRVDPGRVDASGGDPGGGDPTATSPQAAMLAALAAASEAPAGADRRLLVATSPATGRVRFLRPADRAVRLSAADPLATPEAAAAAFLAQWAPLFGATAGDLVVARVEADGLGGGHRVVLHQERQGIPVFAGRLHVHLDDGRRVRAVNGSAIPLPSDLERRPTIPPARAERLVLRALASMQPGEHDPRGPSGEPTAAATAAGPTLAAASATVPALATAPEKPATGALAHPTPLPSGDDRGTPGRRRLTGSTELVYYRLGLAFGVPGPVHLAWQVTATDQQQRRWWVFVDATSGKLLDTLPASPLGHPSAAGALRAAVVASPLPQTGPGQPLRQPPAAANGLRREVYLGGYELAQRVWREGDPLPYLGSGDPADDAAINTIVTATGEVHQLFRRLSGNTRRGYDDADATFEAIYRAPGLSCPNAFWNGVTTSYCAGTASDDMVAHEWTHAYGEHTHGLLYQWQSGALDEAYADIFGELVDLANGSGSDEPGPRRIEEGCSALGGDGSPTVTVHAPAEVAGIYSAGRALFGAPLSQPVRGRVALARDEANEAGPTTTDACTPLTNPAEIAGRIALVDRGVCTFVTKARQVQAAGAIGLIVVNHEGNALVNMGGDAPDVTIPAAFLARDDGGTLRATLDHGLDVTLGLTQLGEQSFRWLIAEDAAGFDGAIRDVWNPSCFANAGRVTDPRYTCGPGTEGNDFGGVHWNSGIASRAFAMLADGMGFNGQQVEAIGVTKAAALWWRAMTVYQHPTTDFADHADALEASCYDLVASGVELPHPFADGGSGERMTGGDCLQLSRAIAAVELRQKPRSCAFAPLLTPNPPPSCRSGNAEPFFAEGFEGGAGSWRATHQGVHREFVPRDFRLTSELPGGRQGQAFFAPNPARLGNCTPGSNDQSGVLRLESPPITLPRSATRAAGDLVLAFDHWLATEPDRDGGTLEVAVGSGPFQPVPAASYAFNPPNRTLASSRNPLAGQRAWSGTDDGSLGGSWGETRVDLGSLAAPGDTVRLRWSLGSDGCNGRQGWYLDDVRGWQCRRSTACEAGPHALCLLDGRYRLELTWANPASGASGRGLALPHADFTGFFAFDDPANVELIVKLLDFGDRVKVFWGQLTDLPFELTVTETATGRTRSYGPTAGNCGGVDEVGFEVALAPAAGDLATPAAGCAANGETLCLLGSRFAVSVAWRNQFDDSRGTAAASALSDLSGAFSFTDPRNVELLVKLLDFGDRILFLWGALSNLEYEIEVADTATGVVRRYANPPGRVCGGIDAGAF
jgi:Zn-dependent metalloprotease